MPGHVLRHFRHWIDSVRRKLRVYIVCIVVSISACLKTDVTITVHSLCLKEHRSHHSKQVHQDWLSNPQYIWWIYSRNRERAGMHNKVCGDWYSIQTGSSRMVQASLRRLWVILQHSLAQCDHIRPLCCQDYGSLYCTGQPSLMSSSLFPIASMHAMFRPTPMPPRGEKLWEPQRQAHWQLATFFSSQIAFLVLDRIPDSTNFPVIIMTNHGPFFRYSFADDRPDSPTHALVPWIDIHSLVLLQARALRNLCLSETCLKSHWPLWYHLSSLTILEWKV